MLAPGGRVVRADYDRRATNRLMVPTENELKTMLYDQVHHRLPAGLIVLVLIVRMGFYNMIVRTKESRRADWESV